MSEWLDLMLAEIARKKREDLEAQEELQRRANGEQDVPHDAPRQAQSK